MSFDVSRKFNNWASCRRAKARCAKVSLGGLVMCEIVWAVFILLIFKLPISLLATRYIQNSFISSIF